MPNPPLPPLHSCRQKSSGKYQNLGKEFLFKPCPILHCLLSTHAGRNHQENIRTFLLVEQSVRRRLGIQHTVPGSHQQGREPTCTTTLSLLKDEVPVSSLRLPETWTRHQHLLGGYPHLDKYLPPPT